MGQAAERGGDGEAAAGQPLARLTPPALARTESAATTSMHAWMM